MNDGWQHWVENDIIKPQREYYVSNDVYYISMDVCYELYHWHHNIIQHIRLSCQSQFDHAKDFIDPSPAVHPTSQTMPKCRVSNARKK